MRILCLDDDPIFTQGLPAFFGRISSSKNIHVEVHIEGTIDAAIAHMQDENRCAAIIFLDLGLLTNSQSCRTVESFVQQIIGKSRTDFRLILLTGVMLTERIRESIIHSLKAGVVHSVLLKYDHIEELERKCIDVILGKRVIPDILFESVVNYKTITKFGDFSIQNIAERIDGLTKTEWSIALMAARGMGDAEIAGETKRTRDYIASVLSGVRSKLFSDPERKNNRVVLALAINHYIQNYGDEDRKRY